DGEHEVAAACQRVRRIEPRARLVTAPAVVREPTDPRRRAEVDLLVLVLADVADPEVVLRVEREPPRVAEPERDDLPAAARRIDAQQLAELRAHVLRALLRIAAGAAVA